MRLVGWFLFGVSLSSGCGSRSPISLFDVDPSTEGPGGASNPGHADGAGGGAGSIAAGATPGSTNSGGSGGSGAGGSSSGGRTAGTGGGAGGAAGGASHAGAAGEGRTPSGAPRIVDLSLDESPCVVFEDGGLRCWGHLDGHPNNTPERGVIPGYVDIGGPVLQVSAGLAHTCALLAGGRVRCWGSAALGYGNLDEIGDDETPAGAGDVDVGGTVVHLSAGSGRTCALLQQGSVRCWGGNVLGYGNRELVGDNETPASVGDIDVGARVLQLSARGAHTCAVIEGGRVRCWGSGESGRLGYGNTQSIGDDETPASAGDVDVGGTAVQVATGQFHTCVLLDGGLVRCWGYGGSGDLGQANTENIGDDEVPGSVDPIDLGGQAVSVGVGWGHSCALLADGTVRCWGTGVWGALGHGDGNSIGDDEPPAEAGPVPIGGSVARLEVGNIDNCVLLTSGGVRCWGAAAEFGYQSEGGRYTTAEEWGDIDFD